MALALTAVTEFTREFQDGLFAHAPLENVSIGLWDARRGPTIGPVGVEASRRTRQARL